MGVGVGAERVGAAGAVEDVLADARSEGSRVEDGDAAGAFDGVEGELDAPGGATNDLFALGVQAQPGHARDLGGGDEPDARARGGDEAEVGGRGDAGGVTQGEGQGGGVNPLGGLGAVVLDAGDEGSVLDGRPQVEVSVGRVAARAVADAHGQRGARGVGGCLVRGEGGRLCLGGLAGDAGGDAAVGGPRAPARLGRCGASTVGGPARSASRGRGGVGAAGLRGARRVDWGLLRGLACVALLRVGGGGGGVSGWLSGGGLGALCDARGFVGHVDRVGACGALGGCSGGALGPGGGLDGEDVASGAGEEPVDVLVGGVRLVDVVAGRGEVVAAVGGDRLGDARQAGGEGVDAAVGGSGVGDVEACRVVASGRDAQGVPPGPQDRGLVVAGLSEQVGGGGRAGRLADGCGDLGERGSLDGEEGLFGFAQHSGAGGVLLDAQGEGAGRVGGQVEDVGVSVVECRGGPLGGRAHGVARGDGAGERCGRGRGAFLGRGVGFGGGGARVCGRRVGCGIGAGCGLVGGLSGCGYEERRGREGHGGKRPGRSATRVPLLRGVHGTGPLGA